MDWIIKKRGRVTYFTKKTNQLFSDLVVEELDNGDLKIRFVGMTGALAATSELQLEEVAAMDPEREIPRVFDTWEMYVREAGICASLAALDFLEIHSFGAAPKAHQQSCAQTFSTTRIAMCLDRALVIPKRIG